MPKQMSPAQIDRLARDWMELDARQESLDKQRSVLREEILACIDQQGELADRSSKTQVAEGSEFDLRVTSSAETRVDQKAARAFLSECPRTLGEQIFRREEKLVLVETPDRLPGGAELSVKARRLFQEAVVVKPRSPRIEARSHVPEKKEQHA